MSTRLLPVERLSTSEIKQHFVDTITNHRSTIDELKEVFKWFESMGDMINPFEKEQQNNVRWSLERLHNEIYYLSRLVDYDEIYGGWWNEEYKRVFGKDIPKKNYIQKYLNDYYNKTYVVEDNEEVK